MITSKTLLYTVENPISVANGTLTATIEHTIFVYEGKKGIDVDVEETGLKDIKYLGMEVGNEYKEYKKFLSHFAEMGIDMEGTIDKAMREVDLNDLVEELKKQFNVLKSL